MFDEGRMGVALFMTLSGYLFAKLLAGKDVQYGRFFLNRFVRLAPLLVFVFAVFPFFQLITFPHLSFRAYAHDLLTGFILPTWPNGGWSIAAEMHFYVLLPLILLLVRNMTLAPVLILADMIALRTMLFLHYGDIETASYFTLFGRFDQFLLGIVAFQFSDLARRRHLQVWAAMLGFLAISWLTEPGLYARHSSIWIWLPTIQGAAFGLLIAYYDTSFTLAATGLSKLLGRIGTYSYSIYLLHPFFVFRLPLFINHRIVSLHNFYVACAAAVAAFCGMACVGWLSFTLIEKPFLAYRVRYTRQSSEVIKELAPA
jgi:peptidoglycan/LPS O-acetylase OafA/YrhL